MDRHFDLRINDFYDDTSILITGGTGFLGKVVIEKLLRSCENVKRIYVLIRSNNGRTSEQRLHDLRTNQIFDRIRAENPVQLKKLICVSGDIAQPLIGLSDGDAQKLLDTVNIVFHSAATVKFNEDLKVTINLNSMGTKAILDLCTRMKYLKSVVHVSTAYSNPCQKFVREMVYPMKLNLDIDPLLNCAEMLSAPVLQSITDSLLGPHPNTYTQAKAIAELISSHYYYHRNLPIVIVRPAGIGAAVDEPFKGWIDSMQGLTRIITEIGHGTLATMIGSDNTICDLVPVDIASSMVITAAWYNYCKASKTIRVFNCTSANVNPLNFGKIIKLAAKYGKEYPSKFTLQEPSFAFTSNAYVQCFQEYFYHLLLISLKHDILRKYKGLKPIARQIFDWNRELNKAVGYYSSHGWIFETTNATMLLDAVNEAKDGKLFRLDMETIDWDDYIKNYVLGTRKYLMNVRSKESKSKL